MKLSSSILITLFALVSTSFAKDCTPSFDYCGSKLLSSHGFTKDDMKTSLSGSDLADNKDAVNDVENIVFHCKNPGIVGHPKYCPGGCKEAKTDGNGDQC